jgi:hypothetical protein
VEEEKPATKGKLERTSDDRKPNSEDCTSSLAISSVATAGLHEDFNKSPEPVLKRQTHPNPEQLVPPSSDGKHNFELDEDQGNLLESFSQDDSENDYDSDRNHTEKNARMNVTTTFTAADSDRNESDENIDFRSKFSTPISPLGPGSPIGASLVLRNTNNTATGIIHKSPTLSTTTRASSFFNSNHHSSTRFFAPQYICTKFAYAISRLVFDDANDDFAVATWLGFWAYLNVSCANLILKPIMDAVVLELGVENQPKLILASSVLAFLSSVPIGWLFEAPDPNRRKLFKKMGMTRGETQGTSLALFYRLFAFSAISYAVGFKLVDIEWMFGKTKDGNDNNDEETKHVMITFLLKKWGQCTYIAFFLVIHLMKLHSTSLIWGVTTEAMEYEEIARKQNENSPSHYPNRRSNDNDPQKSKKEKTRLQRLARIQLGGTLGSIWGRYVGVYCFFSLVNVHFAFPN